MKPLGHPGRRSLAAALVIGVCVALLNSWPVAHGARREAAPSRAHVGNKRPNTSIPAPYGLYVLNDAGYGNPVANA